VLSKITLSAMPIFKKLTALKTACLRATSGV